MPNVVALRTVRHAKRLFVRLHRDRRIRIYWLSETYQTIAFKDSTSGEARIVLPQATFGQAPLAFTLDASFIYWANGGPGGIARGPLRRELPINVSDDDRAGPSR